MGIWIAAVLNYSAFWNVNVEDKPFNSLSPSLCAFKPYRTKQDQTQEKKKKTGMNGRCGCLTFKSPRHLYY